MRAAPISSGNSNGRCANSSPRSRHPEDTGLAVRAVAGRFEASGTDMDGPIARTRGSRLKFTTLFSFGLKGLAMLATLGGQVILARESAKPHGTKSMQRMVFKNISHDEFDWSWEASSDEGKTWTVQWPIHYKRQ